MCNFRINWLIDTRICLLSVQASRMATSLYVAHAYMLKNCNHAHLDRAHIKMCGCASLRELFLSLRERLMSSSSVSKLLNRLLLTHFLSPSDLIEVRKQSSSSALPAMIRLDFKNPGPCHQDVQRTRWQSAPRSARRDGNLWLCMPLARQAPLRLELRFDLAAISLLAGLSHKQSVQCIKRRQRQNHR